MGNDTLNQCLFCTSKPEPHPQSVGYGAASAFAIRCQNCGAQGPECKTKEEAIARWNNAQAQDFKRSEMLGNNEPYPAWDDEGFKAACQDMDRQLAASGQDMLARNVCVSSLCIAYKNAALKYQKREFGERPEALETQVWLDDPRSKIMLAGWAAIQGTLKDHAVNGHIRGWNIQPVPEAVKAQQFWEGLEAPNMINDSKDESQP